MSSSLHTGIRTLIHREQTMSDTREYHGVLILLGDQPLITPSLINQLISAKYATGKRIIAPRYKGKRGNPVLFDRSLWPELLAITGDEGGKSVIEKYRMDMAEVEIKNETLNDDVDTWEAYQRMVEIWNRRSSLS